jgi:hypothetical protein
VGSAKVVEIFVSYRRDADAYAAAGIFSRLAARFGPDHVFRDCDSMAPGALYPGKIRTALDRCRVVVAVIGPRWLDATDDTGRRIDNPKDWVRIELSEALRRGIPVIPVVLDETVLPGRSDLPSDIGNLALSQSFQVRHNHLDEDVARLAGHLEHYVPDSVKPEPETPARNHWVQHNTASEGGQVNAVQGGTMNITATPYPLTSRHEQHR